MEERKREKRGREGEGQEERRVVSSSDALRRLVSQIFSSLSLASPSFLSESFVYEAELPEKRGWDGIYGLSSREWSLKFVSLIRRFSVGSPPPNSLPPSHQRFHLDLSFSQRIVISGSLSAHGQDEGS